MTASMFGRRELVPLMLVLLLVMAAVSQASRGFMVLEENRAGRESPAQASSQAQDPGQILYQLFAGGNGYSPLQGLRQLAAQPVQNLLSQPAPTFGSVGSQLDGMLATGYDQLTRRVQQAQQAVPNLEDGERLLRQMYEMVVNPEEMCRQLAVRANPALEQSQSALQQAAAQMSQLQSAASSPTAAAGSLLNRFMGKK